MGVKVNGIELTDAEVEQELTYHQDTENPLEMALNTLVVRRLLLDEANRLGVQGDTDEAVIDSLLAKEVALPQPDEETCRRHYQQHPEHFTVGECLEAEHILFQVTQDVDLQGLRQRAQAVLEQVQNAPAQLPVLAKQFSNCSSAAVGGSLGQLSRGQTVPEFERVVFAMPEGQVLPRLLETRHGLHVVRVLRRAEGNVLPYDQVSDSIRDALSAANQAIAWRQFLQRLAGQARIEGMEHFTGADSPLMQ